MNYRPSPRFRPWAAAAWLLALALLTLCAAQSSLAQIQLLGSSQASGGAVVTTPRVRAELVAHAPDGVTPGQPLWLGLRITHQPEWHTYWKNAGDSGLPTQLQWQLPAGLEAGEIDWPVPEAIRVGPLVNYGYEGELLLPVPFKVAPDFQAPTGDTVTLRLHASWLVCRVECIPEEGDFTLQLPVRGATAMHAPAFAAAQAGRPAALQGRSSAKVEGERLQLRIVGLPAALQGQNLTLFPETPEVLEHAAVAGSGWTQAWDGAVWTADWPLSAMRGETPGELPLVVAPVTAPSSGPQAWRTVATVEGRWSSAPVASVSPALAAALAANAQAPMAPAAAGNGGFWMALLGGLVGGLILNLMPCVFPVLAIKIVGFARHGQDRRALRIGGLAYGAGVLLSFLALGGLLLALRAAGQQLGWGFQLQSPGLVAAMAVLFTLLGLNLAGMFEFGRMLPQRWASAQVRHPVGEAFLSGVLAVAIASPCTAPFMGASLGLAIDMPAAQALTVFAALGVGMALPYVLASFVPALVRWLPRPGAWMETFRRAMAFPMFATVAWLVWVLGQQSGIDGAGALLVLLVALSALVWALTLGGKTRWLLGAGLLLVTLGLGSVVGPHITRAAAAESAPTAGTSAGEWQPWSAERVSSLTAAGTPVFVDFTAAWCVTCQVNKHTTLNRDDVLADFAARGVTLLRADWTRRDPAITQALTALGRSGVPVYVLYAPGKPPHVMTELLSPAEVHAALQAL